jgi:uncharacterized repeat protein (TIGR03837 family)
MRAMLWDLFCRVVDNFGDAGVCWRLAADLAARGERVRLHIDDARALAWMAPGGAAGVEVLGWPAEDVEAAPGYAAPADAPGDVVIEAFGCKLPPRFVARMAVAARAPVWIDLEYLSAEPYVERSHRLPSPQTSGPGAGLRKTFFYPGFTARTGGLLREPGLLERQARFDAAAWLAGVGAGARPGERVVSLFCYAQPALAALFDSLSSTPTLLLATAGEAASQVAAQLGPSLQRGRLRAVTLPHLTQVDFDHLLWAADLNFVRGEDSFVRAQWAARPFVWQIYPQLDGAHLRKLEAFAERFGASVGVRRLWHGWNGAAPMPAALPEVGAWQHACEVWRTGLLAQADLTTQLLGFVAETR